MLTDPPRLQWLFEIGGALLAVIMAVYFVRQCVQQRQLTRNTLIFFAGFSMWWQEWFGDWAAYLIFNPNFALLPWGSTPWTTPYKPWSVVVAYGWYFTMAFLVFFWVLDRIRVRRPDIKPWVAFVIVGIPVFYIVNLMVEGTSVAGGMWTYTNPIGPHLEFAGGTYPLIYPMPLGFAIWSAFMGTMLYWVDKDGYTKFDNWVGMRLWARLLGSNKNAAPHADTSGGNIATLEAVEAQRLSPAAQAARLVAWIVGFNAAYWFLNIFPMILIRIFLIAEPSTLVP